MRTVLQDGQFAEFNWYRNLSLLFRDFVEFFTIKLQFWGFWNIDLLVNWQNCQVGIFGGFEITKIYNKGIKYFFKCLKLPFLEHCDSVVTGPATPTE